MLLFQSALLVKQKKYDVALNFMRENEKSMSLDKITFLERMIQIAIKMGDKDLSLENINLALKLNSENAGYYIDYINVISGLQIKNMQDLMQNYSNQDEQILKIIQEDLKPRVKSRLLNIFELGVAQGDKFKSLFLDYFYMNINQSLPSFFINIKFIYLYQTEKLSIIEEIVLDSLKQIKEAKSITHCDRSLSAPHHIVWVYYYAAQHFDFNKDLEKALTYMDMAIDSTPTVVEFFMMKAKILKHGGMLKESEVSIEKAKKLDLGDRFLNAKHAKVLARKGTLDDINQSNEVMKEFVRDPLSDDNLNHLQCMWYESECGYSYLRNKSILRAHRLFKSIYMHFVNVIEDQCDFYNYCLRRFMISDFASTIEFMDRISDNKYLYKSLRALEMILCYLKRNSGANSDLDKSLKDEYDKMKEEKIEKYTFSDTKSLINDIENDMYNACLKLQAYSKNCGLHHVAVRVFLSKGKVLLALKSLIYLQNNYSGTFEYLDAIHGFNHYLSSNKDKIPENFITIIHEKVDLVKSEDTLIKFLKTARTKLSEENCHNFISNILMESYENVFNDKGPVEKAIEGIAEKDKLSLRKVRSEDINMLKVYMSLFSTPEFSEKLMV